MIQVRPPSQPGASDASDAGAAPADQLPYVIELWNLRRTAPERIVARAASATLARAIFQAAQVENLGRRIVLRRGGHVLMQTD